MAKIIRIKNTGVDGVWVGQLIQQDTYYDMLETEINNWCTNDKVFSDISSGRLVVNNGSDTVDDLSSLNGWKWISTETQMPISELDGVKIAVHSSPKPIVNGVTTYVVWTGSGDHPDTGLICGGELLEYNLEPGLAQKSIDVKFNQAINGRVWIHEGYLKFENGGNGDHFIAEILSEPTPLQTLVNLDLVVDSNGIISYAGPGVGTHGWADATKIVLIPRTFSKNGKWDYDGTNLTPNLSGTGEYNISTNEEIIHRYINKIPCRGSCNSYFSMTSNETTEIFENYFMRVTAVNASNTTWYATVLMEIYRERTYA